MTELLATSKPVVIAILILIIYPVLTAVYNIYFHPLSHVTGPWLWSCSRLPYIVSLLRGTMIHDVARMHRKYGPAIRIAPNEVTFVQPEAWDDILNRTDKRVFPKDPVFWNKMPGWPDYILSAIDTEKHAIMRKLLAPGFTSRALRVQEPILHLYVNLLVERLKERVKSAKEKDLGVHIDVGPWLNFTTFDIFGDLGFGESFNCLQNSQYHPWIALIFDSVKATTWIVAARFYPLVEMVLMKAMPASLKKAQADHYQHIVGKVSRRLNWELERPDIMSQVIRQEYENKGMTRGELDTNFMILTTAGSETSATALSGAFYYLVRNKDVLACLTNEVRNAFASDQDMTLDALKNLPYLDATLHETLRLCPPVPWVMGRRAPTGGAMVCGVWLPGGTPVSIQAWALSHSPNYFHLPYSFAPERWLPEVESSKSPYHSDRRDAVQPFGVGPRNCIGQHLAWAELRLILAKLLWQFDFDAVEGDTLQWESLRAWLLVEKMPINVSMRVRTGLE